MAVDECQCATKYIDGCATNTVTHCLVAVFFSFLLGLHHLRFDRGGYAIDVGDREEGADRRAITFTAVTGISQGDDGTKSNRKNGEFPCTIMLPM
jgi:hypothetical protein